MKQLMITAAILLSVSTAFAQTQPATGKDHVCSASCNNGQHMLAHGEKGHTCSDACMKTEKKAEMPLKDHVCTSSCKNGNHMLLHGEKGHTCTEACHREETEVLKDHKCSGSCKNGKHVYAHGEKGHQCTNACKKPGM